MATIVNRRFGWMAFLLLILQTLAGLPQALAQDALCAEVKIEIKQKLSLERQAFDAHMRISNGLDTSAIENVSAVLHFEDDKGNPVTATSNSNDTSASFFARIDSLSNINDIEGSGRVNAKTTADIHWLIIPAQGTGGSEPGGKLYYIGATLNYTLNGQPSSVDVTPDYVTVKPQPLLDLDYFLAGDVYADDAFTAETEPPIPFTLGVRIKNVGGGAANKVTIESAQPKIVENVQGLLIDFKILESYVSDQPAGKSLLIDFGDIAPKSAKVGRWNMVTTLSGRFVEIDASYTHADSLGGALTSLIRNINSYLLVHDVKVDLPGRDSIRDFLAYSGDVLRLFESDGVDSSVIDQSKNATLQANGGVYQLTFPATTGFAYVKLSDPFAGKKAPGVLKRSDGKLLPPENIWLSQTRDENNNWQYFINFFDANTTGRYTFDFADGTTASVGGVVFYDANSNGQQDEGETGLGNVKVTLQGSDNEGAGVSTPAYTDVDGKYTFVSLKPGTYQLKVDAIDGYINGVRIAGSAGGVLSVDEVNLITDIVLTAGANAGGYRFAKRKPAAQTAEADLGIAMSASATTVQVNDTVTFALVASNTGPAAANDVKITDLLPSGLSLVSAVASVGDYNSTTGVWSLGTMAKGASATLSLSVKIEAITDTVVNRATVASAMTDPNAGNNSAQVTLTAKSQELTLTHVVPKEARILVLASCLDGNGDDDTACAQSRATWMTSYLAGQGFIAQAVTSSEDFRVALRGGTYNTYWIHGGAAKLSAPLADEVRIAVARGDTLITDGTHDAAADAFNSVTGTTPETAFDTAQTMTVDGATVSVAGHATALTLDGATALARFDTDGGVALARNAYGRGQALAAGFDLLATVQNPTSEAAMHAFFREVLVRITPTPPENVVGNAYVPLLVTVTAPETEAPIETEISINLPAGTRVLDATPAPTTLTATRATWSTSMTSGAIQTIRLGVALPSASAEGNALFAATATGGNTPVTADVSLGITTIDSDFIQSVVAHVQGGSIVPSLEAAKTAYQQGDYTAAIESLVTADRALTLPVTDSYRHAIGQWLQEAELLWQNVPVTPAVPASIAATAGTPQSTVIGTVFSEALQATVRDADSQPVAGALVTFTLPATGASAVFTGGGLTAASMTDNHGVAVSPNLTANAVTGTYTATASVAGVATPASFTLTHLATAPVAASIAAVAGTPQTATVNGAFGQTLRAKVLDAQNQPVANARVTFTLPTTGASAAFAGGGITATALTNAEGIALSPILAANGVEGAYTASATVTGVATPASFTLTNTPAAQTPDRVIASAGTPQSTTVNTAFAQGLQAAVVDAQDQPVPGITVTFTVPVSGASASFAAGSTATAVTDGNGVATAPVLTANGTAGSYQVRASVIGVADSASFALTNEAGSGGGEVPASIVAINGAVQVATVNTAFAQTLQARVLTADEQPVAGVAVTFTLPGSGASAQFANGQASATGVTNNQGIATSPALTANATAGSYQATAKVSGVVQTADFALVNSAISGGATTAATTLIAMGGTPQITAIGTSFAQPLQVMALDASSRPVPDLDVSFTLPTSGASARFIGDVLNVVIKTDAQGIATSPLLIANAVAGSFTATASAEGLSVDFSLNNREQAVVPTQIVASAGMSQATMVGTAFGETLQATVLDANGQPVPGVRVAFALPATGASAAFPGNLTTIIVATDSHGRAATPVLTANSTAGEYQANASVEGIAQTAAFPLMNSATPVIGGDTPASIMAIQGTPQTATVNTAFAQTLQAKVADASGHPVANVTVTFTAPGTGASARFMNGAATVTAVTGTNGVAVSPVLTANAVAGSYAITAAVEGVTAVASFGLTNEAAVVVPVAGSITVSSGSSQTATVDTAFAEPLKVVVRDTGNQPLGHVAVTFTLPGSGASATFGNGRNTLTVLTDSSGVATTSALTANGIDGSYTATASVVGVATTASFALTNEATPVVPVAGSVVVVSGTPQNAIVNTAFALSLKVGVRDTADQPMAGVTVTFTLPASGASATFAGGLLTATAMTGTDGVATSPILTANATVGSYSATAEVAGVTAKANFALTNEAVPVLPAGSITAHNGTPQSATVSTAFAQPLEALVRNTANQPMVGVTVTFTLPASGASATFAGGVLTATAVTGADGVATSPILTANATVGSYTATAQVNGVTAKASFALANTAASGGTSHTFSGGTSTGTGTVTASVSGGGPNCAFNLDKTKVAKPSGFMMQLLGKYLLPHGVFQFELVSCTPGSTVTITTTWPNLQGMTGYMKYGPIPAFPWAPIWYVPDNLRISGNTVTYTITDGKLGDDDLTRNGVIRDPGGPILMASSGVPIPTLSDMGRYLLMVLLALVAAYRFRRTMLIKRNG